MTVSLADAIKISIDGPVEAVLSVPDAIFTLKGEQITALKAFLCKLSTGFCKSPNKHRSALLLAPGTRLMSPLVPIGGFELLLGG